jgi:hypothetical protein
VLADWSSDEHARFVALVQQHADPMSRLSEITRELDSPSKSVRDVELHLKAYFARFMDNAAQSGALPPTVDAVLQSSLPTIRGSALALGMSSEFACNLLNTSGGFASLLADHYSSLNTAAGDLFPALETAGSAGEAAHETSASDALAPVQAWSSDVAKHVAQQLEENVQLIQQMQGNLAKRNFDANVDLMQQLYNRLKWATQATETFKATAVSPLPLQLNTVLIRTALAGARSTPIIPVSGNKGALDALRAKASAQLDRLQQQKQAAKPATTAAAPPTKKSAPRKRAAAGGKNKRRKKRATDDDDDDEDDDDGDDDDDEEFEE